MRKSPGYAEIPVIIIKMAKGRSAEQEARSMREFADPMAATLQIDPGIIPILIGEPDRENIGKAGTPLSVSR
ncbi:MAG: tautomerase family protein [Methanoregulaceae archaeon]